MYIRLHKFKTIFKTGWFHKQSYLKNRLTHNLTLFSFLKMHTDVAENAYQSISEGFANVKIPSHIFYNPVQEFNRDLSISVLNLFSRQGNVTILEALAATGLRSIRYAKEVNSVKQIVANDISAKAVECIRSNICENNVEGIVVASECDATLLMYQHRSKEKQFDVIDLDPYGCPSRFLDAAVQAVKDGGMLLVTATDMAVLAGNSPETCYSKYGAISLRVKSCHEMALRILLQCIESHANRYGKYIEPVLSLSADFYIRVFVKVHSSAYKCKYTTSKLSLVYQCTGCDTFTLQPLGVLQNVDNNKNQHKFRLPSGPPVGLTCEHCGGSYRVGGPIWSAPIHSQQFIEELVENIPQHLTTKRRIEGMLSVISEELSDCPLYFILEQLTGTIHIETPPMMAFRSAILNAGYKVSFTHCHRTSIKTNAPPKVIWDIMRCWEATHPIKEKRKEIKSPGNNILAIKPEKEYSFSIHPNANPPSRKKGFVRFQENPQAYWGPGTRATAMLGDNKMEKSRRNQGKRKRNQSEENSEEKK